MSSTTKSDVIDMDAFNLEWLRLRDLDETEVEAVGSAEDAPPSALTLLLELKTEKSGIETGRNLEVAHGDLDMINTSRVDWGGRPQPGSRPADLEVHRGGLFGLLAAYVSCGASWATPIA